MFEAHIGAQVVLDVQDGVHDIPSEQAAGAQAVELRVMEAMINAEVASGLDAAFKTIDAVDSMAGEEMKLLGSAGGPVPEELEVVVQVWVSVVEGVQVEDVNALASVEH